MTTFIRSPQNQGGFQQGWNMIMNLYGKKQIAERTEAQQKQFDQTLALQQKRFDASTKLRDLQEKDLDVRLKIAERTNKIHEQLEDLDPEDKNYEKKRNRLRMLLKPGGNFKFEETPGKVSIWKLPNHEIVRSYTAGQTYVGASGEEIPMPPGSFKFSGQYTGTEIAALQKMGEAEGIPQAHVEVGDAKAAAREGTGLWANLGAVFDAIAGGLGFDVLLGKNGFFRDIQDARQQLNLIKRLIQ
jgi:hypothetical protein